MERVLIGWIQWRILFLVRPMTKDSLCVHHQKYYKVWAKRDWQELNSIHFQIHRMDIHQSILNFWVRSQSGRSYLKVAGQNERLLKRPKLEGCVTNYRYDMGIGSNKLMFLLNSLKDILVHYHKQRCNQFACIHNRLSIFRLLYQGFPDAQFVRRFIRKGTYSLQVHETLTGFHCGSHSSLISLIATSFVAADDPIKIKAGDNFMFV